jgi:outer membrane protein assembly factor BamD (BamD/ComL family)
MSDPTDDQSQPRDASSNVSGGVNASAAGGQVNVGGDAVGRDKTVSAQTYIEKVGITYRPEETGQPAAERVASYLDFEVEIAQGHGREYPVAVVKSPAGEARETLKFPFDELALENRLKALQIALLRSGGSRRQVLSPEEHAVQDFGRELFNALVTGEARSRYDVSVGAARQQGKGLRLKLRILPPELAKLPWEFLYDPREAEYVRLSRDTPVVRYLELPQPVQPLLVQPPLRILGMIVSPRDLPSLDVAREKQRVETALGDLQKQRLIDLKWLEGQTWRDLQRAMRSGPWHIFHFIGHGGFDSNADEGVIALADETGCAQRMLATELGRLLADHRSLRLVLLNSCEGARGSEHDVFSSTAAILVRRGLPAVVAMQYEITDRAAVEFARSFYEALAEGLPVDAAVAEARKAISLAVPNTVEWGTPVLYMRAPQGAIFQLPETPRVRQRTPQPAPGIDKELEQRLEQLFTEGLAAFWVEDWEKACRSFQAIIEVRSDYPDAAARLEEAKRQRRLNALYVQAQQAQEARSWPEAIAAFETLTSEAGDFKGAAGMLRSAKAQKQLADLYAEARRLSQAKQWQAVVNVFAQIAALQPDYADPDGLLPIAQKEVAELKRQAELDELYSRAVRELDARRWLEAQRLLLQVQQAEPGFHETDRLMVRAEAEIAQEQAAQQRQEQIAMLYEQAVGLARARQWRQTLAKMLEVQQIDPQFADAEGVAAQAQAEIEREEQETQRQSELAALYAEAVRLLKANKYQEALEKWGEVQARDPKYPDRQHVSITAQKKLGALAKPVPRKRQIPKRTLALMGGAVVIVAAVIVGLMYFSGLASGVNMYDDFNNPAYDGSYNKNLWEEPVPTGEVKQGGGVIMLSQAAFGEVTGLDARNYNNMTLQSPIFFEAKLKLDPAQNAGNVLIGPCCGKLDTNCMVAPYDDTHQVACCWIGEGSSQPLTCSATEKLIEPGSWHTFRIEFDPVYRGFTFFMDNERIGAYTATAAQVAGDLPTFMLRVHKSQTSPAVLKGYFDDVRIGPLQK